MKHIHHLFWVALFLTAFQPSIQAGGSNKKKDVFTIRIHGEASPEDGDKFSVPVTLMDGRSSSLSIMPLLTEHEIKAVLPFKSPDGSGGANLYLDGHGANLLSEYSVERMGRGNILAVMINGRQTVDLLVDKPVNDGIFVIPSGMTMAEEARLVNAYPIFGEEKNPKQKKKKQPFSPTNIMLPPKASDLQNASAPVQ
jgi:hypothetical protein